jgi:metal-sulfur cluster biosynthetic enzyme
MSASVDSNVVWDLLRSIPDPEFGINIVDLGLIYSVDCADGNVAVTMTLTTPSCPSGGWIYEGTKQVLANLPGAKRVEVNMVFEPPWTPAMLSESAQRQLGRID